MSRQRLFSLFVLLMNLFIVRAQVTEPVAGEDYFFDLRDGSILPTDTDGKSPLNYGIFRIMPGSENAYGYNGNTHGAVLKTGNLVEIDVAGSVTIRVAGCQYTNQTARFTLTSADGSFNDSREAKTENCIHAAPDATVDFVYTGGKTTLKMVISGGSVYVPYIEVLAPKKGNMTSVAERNRIYEYNLADGSIIPTDTDGKSNIAAGLMEVLVGAKNAYGYNGPDHGSVLKAGNTINLQVSGNTLIRIGGCQYSKGNILVSSVSGAFNHSSQSAATAGCFHNTGDFVDFIYAGDAGIVSLDFDNTAYIPYIVACPIPYTVELAGWKQKSGTITVNGITMNLTSGASTSENPTLTLSKGTVISVTAESASVRIDLGGKTLAASQISFGGDIAGVTAEGDNLVVTYADAATKPNEYVIAVTDDSQNTTAQPGKTYTYNFTDNSCLPNISYTTLRYPLFITKDGLLTLRSNTDNEKLQFGFHDGAHGAVFFPGNSMEMQVAGNAVVTVSVCQYGSATDAVFEFSDASGTVLGEIAAKNNNKECGTESFSYTGKAGVLKATLKSEGWSEAEIYIHGISVENAPQTEASNGLADVWDFGAAQLDGNRYNNRLTAEVINGWYDAAITPGSTGHTFPSFSAGILSWVGGGNDRLRSSNTALTRYDNNGAGTLGDETFTGALYVNASAAKNRYLSIALQEDDEVCVYAKTQNGNGKLTFEYVADPIAQTDVAAIGNTVTLARFVARAAGTYHIFDAADKPFYFRVIRKEAEYVTVSGTVHTGSATLPADYALVFTNEAGKSWQATPAKGAYSVKLPKGESYAVTLANAPRFIITGDKTVTPASDVTFDVAVSEVELVSVTGTVTGLPVSLLSKLNLQLIPEKQGALYEPQPEIAADGSYTMEVEPNVTYRIVASGVNDYRLTETALLVSAAATVNVGFEPKPVYDLTITGTGLTPEQNARLRFTFVNLHEAGYAYSFGAGEKVALRDGVYSVVAEGVDALPLQQALTSNLKIEGQPVTKQIVFETVTQWPFNDRVIAVGDTAYKGLLLSGNVSNEMSKGHLVGKEGAVVRIPMNPNEKAVITYYYSADFSVNGGEAITTTSGSTSAFETTEYVYPAAVAGYADIVFNSGSSYITNISTKKITPYAPKLTVGKNGEFATIGEALGAVACMERPNGERVEIMIEPGNYEEMLVIDQPNVSLVNAAAAPGIGLLNNGVDIEANAVRITSYYGHGYHYYSMHNNQKWNADVLRVNKENGYLSYENTGSGSTNGSYWNATVVIAADGFIAESIIFENSFNQYISVKESEDVVVEWQVGGKGTRPTDAGNTQVQNKNFVERAAAVAITNNTDKTLFNKCRIIGRQDSFYGGTNARVAIFKGCVMGACDYIFGGMVAAFYQTELMLNTSDDKNDVAYITAAQQSSGRGYLMYECTVNSATPGIETASANESKPGYFGRPWTAATSEVVFYNTRIAATAHPDHAGKSLIEPAGWNSSLGGESPLCYEYNTSEASGEDNSALRASWSQVLSSPVLADGTPVSLYNFTKGNDGWDPFKALIEDDPSVGIIGTEQQSIKVVAANGKLSITNLPEQARIAVYSVAGQLQFNTVSADRFETALPSGIWIVNVATAQGSITVKVVM